MALTAEKFAQGWGVPEYIDQIKVNKQPFMEIYEAVVVPPDVLDYFGELAEPLNLAVFNAEWCGDAVSTTPAVLKLAESTDKLSVRVFNRDEEVDLANSFLPEHRANTVPVFVVFDRSMNQVARFIETALQLVPQIDAMDELIARETAGEGENVRTVVRGKRTAFRVAHAREWGEVILQEFRQVVQDGLALPPEQRPAEGGTQWPAPQG
jgi:thiol-disulfide isomerase/thioredoxin